MAPLTFPPVVTPIHGSTAGALVHGGLPSLNFSSRSLKLPPKDSTSPHFSPALSRPATHPLAATSLVRSHGSTPASMDELLLLQRIISTCDRVALEGSGRGYRSGCRMPLPTSTAAEGRHVPVETLNTYGTSVSDPKKRTKDVLLPFLVTFSKDFQKQIVKCHVRYGDF